MEYGDLIRAFISYSNPISSSCLRIGAVNSSNTEFRSLSVAWSFLSIDLYSSGCSYLKLRFSSSDLIAFSPNRFANGAYIYSVSPDILYRLLAGCAPNVRMLWSLSAILIRITRMSSFIVSNNFLKFSAWAEALSPKIPPEILVSPSTI